MTHPTTEQLNDPKWWDENAPKGATHYTPETDLNFECWWMLAGGDSFCMLANRPEDRWSIEPMDEDERAVAVSRPDEDAQDLALARSRMDDESETVSITELREQANRPYYPDPGTEALATWLEPPDGGDRRPERVLVKGYYTHTDDREQVWFTTQEGEDLVHLTDNVLFEPLDTKLADALAEIISTMEVRYTDGSFELFPGPVVDELLSRFDVSFKE